MRKLSSYILTTCLLLAACTQEELLRTDIHTNQETEFMQISATVQGDPDTRLSYDEANKTDNDYTFTWENGDKLIVVGYDAQNHYVDQREFTTTTAAISGGTAKFTGPAASTATNFKLYYQKNGSTNPSVTDGVVTFSCVNQKVTDNAKPTAHISNYLLLEGVAPTVDALRLGVNLSMKNALMRLTIPEKPAGITNIKKVIWEVYGADGTRTNEVALEYQTAATTYPLYTYLSFNDADMKLDAKDCYLIVRTQDEAGKEELARALSSGKWNPVKGHRYQLNVTDKSGGKFTWLRQGANEIWYKKKGDAAVTGVAGYTEAKVVGTDYWALTQTAGNISTVAANLLKGQNTITEVILPEGVTRIDDEAFSGMAELTTIHIPNSLTTAGKKVFESCPKLAKFTGNDAHVKDVVPGDGKLFVLGETLVRCAPASANTMSVTMPAGITKIHGFAFSDCTKLTGIDMKDVTGIGEGAFKACTALSGITMTNVSTIGEAAFKDCTALAGEITIPETMTTIEKKAFMGCNQITKFIGKVSYCQGGGAYLVQGNDLIAFAPKETQGGSTTDRTVAEIPEGITSINSGAFKGCSALTTVTIPETLREVSATTDADPAPFDGCSGITKLTVKCGTALGADDIPRLIAGMTTSNIDLYINREWNVNLPNPWTNGITWKTVYLVNSDGKTGIEKLPGYDEIL